MQDQKLILRIPDAKAPGFLRRQRRALEFKEQIDAGQFSVALLDDIIAFLLDYVVEPTDRNAARDLLLDASQDDFAAFLASVTGAKETPLASADGSAMPSAGTGNPRSNT